MIMIYLYPIIGRVYFKLYDTLTGYDLILALKHCYYVKIIMYIWIYKPTSLKYFFFNDCDPNYKRPNTPN